MGDAASSSRRPPQGSTADQQLGLRAQRADIERYAGANGLEVVAWHTEVISGGAPFEGRKVLNAALADVATLGAGALVVAKRDRLSRDPLTALLVERALGRVGACLLAADGANGADPAAELMRGILDSVARFERRMIGLRTKAALAAKRARGEPVGRPPGRKDTSAERRAITGVRLGRPRAAGPTTEDVRRARAGGDSWSEVAGRLGTSVGIARRRAAGG